MNHGQHVDHENAIHGEATTTTQVWYGDVSSHGIVGSHQDIRGASELTDVTVRPDGQGGATIDMDFAPNGVRSGVTEMHVHLDAASYEAAAAAMNNLSGGVVDGQWGDGI